MGAKPRAKPERLPEKLLAIRKHLNASLSKMVRLLDCQVTSARISEYEHGKHEPNLLTLLAYAQIAQITVEYIINDKITLAEFRNVLTGSTRSQFVEQDCP